MSAFFLMPHIGLLSKVYTDSNPFDILLADGLYTSYIRYNMAHQDGPTLELNQASIAQFSQLLANSYPDLEQLLQQGQNQVRDYQLDGTPVFSISENVLLQLHDNHLSSPLSLEEQAYWTMLWAISSKIGTKRYTSTTRIEILSRMFGASCKAELDKRLSSDANLKALYDIVSARRFYERTLLALQADHRIVEYGAYRRTYVALYRTGLTNPTALARMIEQKDRAARSIAIRQEKLTLRRRRQIS